MDAAVVRSCARAFALALVVALLGAAPAGANVSEPFLDLHSAGGLAPDGSSITVQLVASCPERWTVVEALVTVSQPQARGEARFTFPCISSLRPFTVVVPASSGTFVLGDALATASVTIKRGRTKTVQDAESIDVQPTVLADLADVATVESGGAAVSIDVTVACPVGASPQQSYVNVSQGSTVGSGTYVPVCDGLPHAFTVLVQAALGVYQPGAARALTFAFVEHAGISFAGVDDVPVQIVS